MKEKVRAVIIDSCFYVPKKIITNESFKGKKFRDDKTGEITLETDDEWIMRMIGIKERRKSAPEEYASDMAIQAAQQMFETSSIKPTDLDGIVVATSTPDRAFPPTANLLQRGIGARTDIFADDLGSACASFLAAVYHAKNAIESGNARYVLVMASETLTKIIDETSSTSLIFGDGAAGFILGPDVKGRGFLSVVKKNNPYDNVYSIYKGQGKWAEPRQEIIRLGDGFDQGSLRMPDGPKVLKAAVKEMGNAIEQAVEEADWQLSEVELAFCHQANIRIIEKIRKRFREFPNIHFPNNITYLGNMSGVTCPAAFHKAREERLIQDGMKAVFSAYGSGEKTYALTHQF